MEAVRTRLGLGVGPGGGGGFGGGTQNVRGRIGQLKGAIMGSTALPTTTQMMQIREVKAALPQVIDQGGTGTWAPAYFPSVRALPGNKYNRS
jgi:hypothetical protein